MNHLAPLASPRASQPSGAEGLVLQRLRFDYAAPLRGLYVRPDNRTARLPAGCREEAGMLLLARNAAVSFDTYFGAFFESHWRGATSLASLELGLDISGSFALRVLRRSAHGETALLHDEILHDFDGRLSMPLPTPLMPAIGGRLFAEVTALEGGCTIAGLDWQTPDRPAATPVGLVPVFCTFGRERQLGAVLASLAAQPDCWRDLPRIVIVNQGQAGLAAHAALASLPEPFRARLMVIEQGNFGGAGGFTRGLLALRDIPGATHALLMDDDVALEPEAVRRTQAFFAIARPRQVLGGHMLDMLRPTRLYEAGGCVDMGKWYLKPLNTDLPLDDPRSLDALGRPEPMHYNGWWFFALPLALLEEAGLPLPCFIRGDDVEYGLRLHGMEAPITGLPGIAIWHEPFYVKLNGWQLYYETRNMLVAAALHFPRPASSLTVLLFKRMLIYLLTYRYYSASLVLQAIEDYLRGPSLFAADPRAVHASLDRHKAEYPPEDTGRQQVIPRARLRADLASRPGATARLAAAILRNWTQPSDAASPPVRVAEPDLVWFRVSGLDHVAVEMPWDARLTVFRRSRASFRRLFARGIGLLRSVRRNGDAVAASWRMAQPEHAGRAFWERYLHLRDDPPSVAGRDRPAACPQPGRSRPAA